MADLDAFATSCNIGVVQRKGLTTPLSSGRVQKHTKNYARIPSGSSILPAHFPTEMGIMTTTWNLSSSVRGAYLCRLNDESSEVPAVEWYSHRIFDWNLFPWMEEGTYFTTRKEWRSVTGPWCISKEVDSPNRWTFSLS